MSVTIREFVADDVTKAIEIWNEVVAEGKAFPQLTPLTVDSGMAFFNEQSYVGIAELDDSVVGMYILHPNNIGRCGHIANASYAVKSTYRGKGIGRELVSHSLKKAKELGFSIMQFNAVVNSNKRAIALYKSLGFVQLGTIPKGFRMDDGSYEDIIPFYHTL